GDVLPGTSARVIDEEAVINRVGMFIEEKPRLGRFGDLSLLQVLLVLLKAPIKAPRSGIIIGNASETAKDRIHGEAAITARVTGRPLSGTEVIVGRTFIIAYCGGGVLTKCAIGNPGIIGVADIGDCRAGPPGHYIVHPVVQ